MTYLDDHSDEFANQIDEWAYIEQDAWNPDPFGPMTALGSLFDMEFNLAFMPETEAGFRNRPSTACFIGCN